jgi:hypothetical protein
MRLTRSRSNRPQHLEAREAAHGVGRILAMASALLIGAVALVGGIGVAVLLVVKDPAADGSDSSDADPPEATFEVDETPAIDRPALAPADPPNEVLFVGDSVLVSIEDELDQQGEVEADVYAVECRALESPAYGPCGSVPAGTTITSGLDALSEALVEHPDPDAIVLVLANNSLVTDEAVDQAMALIPPDRPVWWVLPLVDREWEQDNVDTLRSAQKRYPAIGIIDWPALARGKPWLRDEVHPNDIGQQALAGLIINRLTA